MLLLQMHLITAAAQASARSLANKSRRHWIHGESRDSVDSSPLTKNTLRGQPCRPVGMVKTLKAGCQPFRPVRHQPLLPVETLKRVKAEKTVRTAKTVGTAMKRKEKERTAKTAKA